MVPAAFRGGGEREDLLGVESLYEPHWTVCGFQNGIACFTFPHLPMQKVIGVAW